MMALVPPQLVLSLDRAALSGLYPWLEAECLALGMAEPALQRLHVAVEEAVMNVAMHAYAPDADGKIWLTIARSEEHTSELQSRRCKTTASERDVIRLTIGRIGGRPSRPRRAMRSEERRVGKECA